MKRFAASIEYYGTNYSGWQKQKQTSDTIQEKVENAFSSIANEEVNVVCSGRTDAGVHALSQVIHFDTNTKRLKNPGLKALTHYCRMIYQSIGLKVLMIRLMQDFRQLAEHTNMLFLIKLLAQ